MRSMKTYRILLGNFSPRLTSSKFLQKPFELGWAVQPGTRKLSSWKPPDLEDFATRIWKTISPPRKGNVEEDTTNNDLIPSTPEFKYRKVLALPLTRRPLMPGVMSMVTVDDPTVYEELKEMTEAEGAQPYVGAFLRRDEFNPTTASSASSAAGVHHPSGDSTTAGLQAHHLHEVGTFARVIQLVNSEDGGADEETDEERSTSTRPTPAAVKKGQGVKERQVFLYGHRRLKQTRTVQEAPLYVEVEHLRDLEFDANEDVLKATKMEIVSTMKDLLRQNPLYTEQLRILTQFGIDTHDPSRLCDLAASLTSADANELQRTLETLSVPERSGAVLLLLKQELELLKLQQEIGARVESSISKDQRRYFLMEQLKSIKKELGIEKDDKLALADNFREKFEPKRRSAPEEVVKVVDQELLKLSSLDPSSSEFNVTRTYLEWLTALPWGLDEEEEGGGHIDLTFAQKVLDEDHFGMQDVKDRILEFIAVTTLRASSQGKIMCLVGPPGVGKTSIGRSIARALNRKYFRFSVGGLSDVAEIKGHRRTYVGAMPGKLVQCLKAVQASNPLVLIDEIDKLGQGYRGDPASALLELLDPEQNASFLDHYLDVPTDLSKVLFMCTANTLDSIPGPLLDRMEVIRLAGYITNEKVHISREYLEPVTAKEGGIPEGMLQITDTARVRLIEEYCREAGVRNLKKHLEKVTRKAALQIVKRRTAAETPDEQHNDGEPIVVDGDDLKEYVGQPPYASERMYDDACQPAPAGVVTGLAWTPLGGSTLYVEVSEVEKGKEGSGSIRTTGQLGDVMKESASIAHTFARGFHSILEGTRGSSEFFSSTSLHVHVPAGATPKDGPSAGSTIVTAMLSLALNSPVSSDLAMTGEISLTGRVLPIGGVKEKTLAARRSGIKTILFPEANRKDWDELDSDLREGLDVHFAESYSDIFKVAFPEKSLPASSS